MVTDSISESSSPTPAKLRLARRRRQRTGVESCETDGRVFSQTLHLDATWLWTAHRVIWGWVGGYRDLRIFLRFEIMTLLQDVREVRAVHDFCSAFILASVWFHKRRFKILGETYLWLCQLTLKSQVYSPNSSLMHLLLTDYCCLDIICVKASTFSGKHLRWASVSPYTTIFDTEIKKMTISS